MGKAVISVTAFIIANKKTASYCLRVIKKKNRISFLYLKFILW